MRLKKIAALALSAAMALSVMAPAALAAAPDDSENCIAAVQEFQVGILNHGKLLFEGPLAALQRHARGGVLLRVLDAQRAVAVLQAQGIRAVTRPVQPDTLELPPLPDEALAALVGALAGSGAGVVGLTSQTKNLEEIFLSLTKGDGEVA